MYIMHLPGNVFVIEFPITAQKKCMGEKPVLGQGNEHR